MRKSRPYTPSRLRVNVYHARFARVWVRLVYDGFNGLELLVADHIPDVGVMAEWYGSTSDMNELLGYESSDGWLKWALEEGLAPNQLFLIEVLPPKSYRCSYEYEEYDVEYSWEVIERAPWGAYKSAKAWSRFLQRSEMLNALHVYEKARMEHEIGVRTDLMFISVRVSTGEFVGAKGSKYTASLYTKLGYGRCLARGVEKETAADAVDSLSEKACLLYPRVSHELIHALVTTIR